MARSHAWLLAVLGLPALLSAGERKAADVPKLAAQCKQGKGAACAELNQIARSHSSLYAREAAIPHVTDAAVLAQVALQDSWYGGRKLAVERIEDPAVLASVVKTDKEKQVQDAALSRLGDQVALAGLASDAAIPQDTRTAIVKRLTDQKALAGFAGDAKAPEPMRLAALENLTDAEALARIGLQLDEGYGFGYNAAKVIAERLAEDKAMAELVKAPSRHMRDAARDKVKNPLIIAEILKSEAASVKTWGMARRVEDPAALAEIALKGKSPETRLAALVRVHDPAILNKVLADTDVKVKQFATRRLAAIKANVVVSGKLVELSLGQPVPDFRLDVYDKYLGALSQTRTDTEGRFTVAGVESGDLELHKTGGGHLDSRNGLVNLKVPPTGKLDLGTLEIRDDDTLTAALAPICDGKPVPPTMADVLFFDRSADTKKGGFTPWRHSYLSLGEFQKLTLGWKIALCVTSSSRSVGTYVDSAGRHVGTAYSSSWNVHVVRLEDGKTWDRSFSASPPQSTTSYGGVALGGYASPAGQVKEWLKTLASSSPAP